MRKRLFFGAAAALAVVLAVGLYLHMGAVESGPPGGPGMANDFTNDPSAKALWRFEPGALYTDSIGGNTLSEFGDDWTGCEEADGAGEYQEGSGALKTIYSEFADLEYLGINDADLDAGFPLADGDTNKVISWAGWVYVVENNAGESTPVYWFEKYHRLTSTKRTMQFGWQESSGEFRLVVFYDGGSQTIETTGAGLEVGKWYHIGLALDGVAKTYLIRCYDLTEDSAATFSGSISNELLITDGPVYIGRFMDARLDEFVVFDELKTAGDFDDMREGVFSLGAPGSGLLDGRLEVFSTHGLCHLDGRLDINTAVGLLDGLAILGDQTAGLLDGRLEVPVVVLSSRWAWRMIPPASTWALPTAQPRREVFVAVLRKTGLADIEVPMASLQMRRRDGLPTMVSCVVPDAATYRGYAEDREGGELIVMAGSVTQDGTRHLSELDRAALETISWDVGVGSSSLSLSGYRTAGTTNPRPVDLSGITYYGLQADGKRRVRGKINIFLRPGDTALLPNGESFVVDQVYVYVEPRNAWMEAAGV
jgi:hypothetical protein